MVAAAVQLVGHMKEMEMLEVMVTVERGAVNPTAAAPPPPKKTCDICGCAPFKWPSIMGSLKVS